MLHPLFKTLDPGPPKLFLSSICNLGLSPYIIHKFITGITVKFNFRSCKVSSKSHLTVGDQRLKAVEARVAEASANATAFLEEEEQ